MFIKIKWVERVGKGSILVTFVIEIEFPRRALQFVGPCSVHNPIVEGPTSLTCVPLLFTCYALEMMTYLLDFPVLRLSR